MVNGGDAGDAKAVTTIGVIMAARNARLTIAESIGSVLSQTVRPAQVVVVDDGSTDDTAAVVEAFARQRSDVQLLRTAPVGRAAARNLALERLHTDLVAVQDADDVALPWRFEEALATFAQHPDAVAVGAQMLAFARPGHAWELPSWPTDPAAIASGFAAGTMAIAHPTAVARRSAVTAAGGYDPAFAYGEDLALFRAISAQGPMVASDRVVTLYRKPRRHSFGLLWRTQLSRRQARDGRLTASARLAALVEVVRTWLRQRVKPLPPERPLSAFGIDPVFGGPR